MITFKIIMLILLLVILISAAHFLFMTHKFGRPGLFWFTFIFALILHQIAGLLILIFLWVTLNKRCMYLKENEHEYALLPEDEGDKDENFIPKFKVICLKMLESSYFELTSLILISLYTVFILYWLTLSDFFPAVTTEILSTIDIIFLSLFMTEIIMKTFASNFRYLFDKFNLFDAIIVVVSFILNLVGIVAKGLGVLRLIRVGVITVRKITGKEHKLSQQGKGKGMDNIESIIHIFK